MKYLLSILILFSGLSFSTNYLICDEPYTFYPDKEKRKLLEIGDSSMLASYLVDSLDGFITTYLETYSYEGKEFLKDTYSIYWYKDKFGIGHYWRIDRETLVIHNKVDPKDEKDSEKPKCKVASTLEFLNAKKELEKLADESTDKYRKEHQKELDKRKI